MKTNHYLVILLFWLIPGIFGCSKDHLGHILYESKEANRCMRHSTLLEDFEGIQDTVNLTIEGGGSRTGLMANKDDEAEIGMAVMEMHGIISNWKMLNG